LPAAAISEASHSPPAISHFRQTADGRITPAAITPIYATPVASATAIEATAELTAIIAPPPVRHNIDGQPFLDTAAENSAADI